MKRKLFIIRHGKSSWDNEGLDDFSRPLAERGIRSANDMAQRLNAIGQVPELILTSPASRALNTALIMSGIWGLEASALQIREPIYMASVSEIEQVVAGVPGEIQNLAIFGHNPAFTMYANKFLTEPLANLPTAGVVIVTLDARGWNGIDRGHVRETYLDYPKRQPR